MQRWNAWALAGLLLLSGLACDDKPDVPAAVLKAQAQPLHSLALCGRTKFKTQIPDTDSARPQDHPGRTECTISTVQSFSKLLKQCPDPFCLVQGLNGGYQHHADVLVIERRPPLEARVRSDQQP